MSDKNDKTDPQFVIKAPSSEGPKPAPESFSAESKIHKAREERAKARPLLPPLVTGLFKFVLVFFGVIALMKFLGIKYGDEVMAHISEKLDNMERWWYR